MIVRGQRRPGRLSLERHGRESGQTQRKHDKYCARESPPRHVDTAPLRIVCLSEHHYRTKTECRAVESCPKKNGRPMHGMAAALSLGFLESATVLLEAKFFEA